MSDSNHGPQKEEVVVLAGGVRARMMAYQQEIQRKEKAAKKNKPVFKVEEDLGVSFHSNDGTPLKDKMPVQDEAGELSLSNLENKEEEGHLFQRSMNSSGKAPDFFPSNAEEPLADEEEIEPEKPQEVKDEEEKVAKEKITRLLERDEEPEEKEESSAVLPAFTAVQRRYLKAVNKLRPQSVTFKKPQVQEEAPEAKEIIRKTLDREMTKSAHLTELTTTWGDYYEKAQDKPTEEEEVKRVEEEVKEVEEQVNTEWSNFAEQVVEIVEEDDILSEDEDMVKWREEARRLKAEAEERKKQKAVREERKKKRLQMAALRKERAEKAAARRRNAEEAARKEAEDARRRQEEEEEARKEDVKAAASVAAAAVEVEAKKRAEESDSDSSGSGDSSDSSDSPELEPEKKPAPKESKPPESALSPVEALQISPAAGSKKAKHRAHVPESDSESSDDNANKTAKKKTKKKKEKEVKEKEVKEKDMMKVKDKKKKKSDKKKKKKGDDDSDLDDGWVEEYPRNFDGTLWRNPLKFWTNRPTKLNEVAPKVIMRPNPNSDIFCKTEDAINDNASFYWNKFQGDFNVLVKIKGGMRSSYDKAGIMVRQDERNWVMSGLEFFNQRINHSSCITRGISDWSLAPLPDEAKDGIWIAIKRHDNKVECFYSYDLKEWIQTRQGLFPAGAALKVGIVAACPMGEPFKVVFERFRIQMVG